MITHETIEDGIKELISSDIDEVMARSNIFVISDRVVVIAFTCDDDNILLLLLLISFPMDNFENSINSTTFFFRTFKLGCIFIYQFLRKATQSFTGVIGPM